MNTSSKTRINFVTSSKYKQEEHGVFFSFAKLNNQTAVRDLFELDFRTVPITEMLTVDIPLMVQAEAVQAYCQMRVPCIVEHAGLIFDDYKDDSYPGGLTKAMWDTLADKFLDETNSRGRKATAQAVIAYCDGHRTHTFIGETTGHLSQKPQGQRKYYWDTIFIPDDENNPESNLTFAEIIEDDSLGIEYKMINLSQSGKAMLQFLEFLNSTQTPELWQ